MDNMGRITIRQHEALDLMANGPIMPADLMQKRSFIRLAVKGLARVLPDGSFELTDMGTEVRLTRPGRPSQFMGAWGVLAESYGGPAGLAAEIGVSYQTTWRWANKRGEPTGPAAIVIETLAEKAGVENPLKIDVGGLAVNEASDVHAIGATAPGGELKPAK